MIPFIVIETAKTEYRGLKFFKKHSNKKIRDLAEHLQIYTWGNEAISPCRINPLEIPENVSKDSHIATLSALFQGAIPMSGPLPSLIGGGLEMVYEEYPDRQHPPIIKNLLNTIPKVMREKNYSPETERDIEAATEVRLIPFTTGSLGKIFQCRQNIPEISELVAAPTIVECDSASKDQKCFLILNLLNQIKEYFKSSPRQSIKNKLRYVIFIEEAHNIIGRSFNASPSPDNPDPKSFVTELICNMLAELRSLGVGIVIIDQLPSAIAPQVVKHTATKIAFRQVDREDREILGSAMLLREYEEEDFARLIPGEAYYYTEGLYRPRKIKTINIYEEYDLAVPLNEDAFLKLIQSEAWFIKNSEKRIASELIILQEQMNGLDDFKIECTKNIAVIISQFPKVLEIQPVKLRTNRFLKLQSKARAIRNDLSANYESFVRGFYNRYLPQDFPLNIKDSELETIGKNIMDRFNSILKPDYEQLMEIMDTFIIKCEEAQDDV